MRVVRLMDEPDWQSGLSPIEEIFFATNPLAKTLRPDERQPFRERWRVSSVSIRVKSLAGQQHDPPREGIDNEQHCKAFA